MVNFRRKSSSAGSTSKTCAGSNKAWFIGVALAFVSGIVIGSHVSLGSKTLILENSRGSIHRLGDTPIRNTSHVDTRGRPVTKQQLIEPFDVPNLSGISVATFLPGQEVELHKHISMHEFFFVLEGTLLFTIGGETSIVKEGDLVHVAPNERHQLVSSNGTRSKMLVTGITIDTC